MVKSFSWRPVGVIVVIVLLVLALVAAAVVGVGSPTRQLPAVVPPPQTAATGAPPRPLVFPRPGELTMGTHGAIVMGVPFTFRVPMGGWESSPEHKSMLVNGYYPGIAWLRFWSPDNVYADPCAHTPISPSVGPSAADLAAAMTGIRGTHASGPTDVAVGGFPAKYVELTIDDDIGCPSGDFYLWYGDGEGDDRGPRWAGEGDSTIRVWIVDVNGSRFVIDSETWMPPDAQLQPGDSPNGPASETRQIVDSIRFVAIPTEVLQYVAQVEAVCRMTSDRFHGDPDVVGGFRQYAPEFEILDNAARHAEAAARISESAFRELRALPAPPEVIRSRVQEVYALLESAVVPLRQVPAAVRAGDAELVKSLLSQAYRLSNSAVAVENEPMSLGLLAPSLSACRLPSGGG